MNAHSPVQDCAYKKLRRLTRCVAHHFDSELAKAGLKTTQLGLLSEILRLQPVRPGELARAVGIDLSTLTRNLKPLIAAGWVELGAGHDARTRTIRITDTGVQTDSLFKKVSCGCLISLGTKQEVDRIAVAIDGPVQVLPLASDPDVSLVHPSTRAHGTLASAKFRCKHRQEAQRVGRIPCVVTATEPAALLKRWRGREQWRTASSGHGDGSELASLDVLANGHQVEKGEIHSIRKQLNRAEPISLVPSPGRA